MVQETVIGAATASYSGAAPFPEIVAMLISAGVEYYHVDYVQMQTTYYGESGETIIVPIPFVGVPRVSTDFHLEDLRAAIVDSQQHGQSYRDFTRRAIVAGVQGYLAFLRGRRVTYWGRQG